MSETLEQRIRNTATEHPTIGSVIAYASDIVELLDERDSRIAALEAALAEAREVVKGVVNNLPESEIEIARPCLGNTNTSIAKQAVARAAEWLKKQEAE